MVRPQSDNRTRWTIAAVATLVLAHTIWPDGLLGELLYLGTTGGAAVVAAVIGLRWPKGERSGALWLAFGIAASALGDLAYSILSAVRHTEADVSVADIAWLASYVGVAVGVLKLLSRGRREWKSAFDDDGLIDMAVGGVVAAVVVWHFWAGPTFGDISTPLLTRSVWAAYPILDAALIGLLVRTMTNRRLHRATLLLLSAGVLCWFLSDLLFLAMPDAAALSRFLDAGWMVGAALLATGTVRREAPANPTGAPEPDDIRVGVARIVATFVPLLVPGLLQLISMSHGGDANPILLIGATVVLAGLACTRAILLAAIARDTNQLLASRTHLYQRLTENSSDAVILLSADGQIRSDVHALDAALGLGPSEDVGRSALDHVVDEDLPRTRQLLEQAASAPGVVFDDELRIRRGDGSELWIAVRAVNLLDDPAVGAIVVNVHDITARKQAEEELAHRAFHDSLTGLANRALFRDRLDHALARRGRTGLDPVVLYLDLDGFKTVNDSLGHEAGDLLLRSVAGRIATVVRTGDTVARLGGDEFAVLVEPLEGPIEADRVADRLLEVLATPIVVGETHLQLSASIGLAQADAHSTASSLLRDADIAMYQAKAAGRNRRVRYEPEMRDAAVQRLQIASDLAQALEEGELHLLYQPVVDLDEERIVGFEALLRWQHPDLGLVSPETFIPIAEENGSIVPIGRWVLHTACGTAADWRDRHPDLQLTMAVNVSAVQLSSTGLVEDVRSALAESGLPPSSLVLELTETALVNDPTGASRALRDLRAVGVRVAIDDFGTGYSSISYLQQFPIDILKVDRSFVQSITESETPAIVRGLLELGHTLELEIVAEGIESSTQLRHLRAQHCEHGQGFLFSRPVDAAAAEALLDERATRRDGGRLGRSTTRV